MLGLLVALEGALLVAAFIRLSLAEADEAELDQQRIKQEAELDQLRPMAERLKTEWNAIKEGRLPGLRPLEMDKVITLDEGYAKSIVFNVSGQGEQRRLEFKVVLSNDTLNLFHPRVDVEIFDKRGMQVGLARLGVLPDGTPTTETIDRGETRSFSGQVDFEDRSDAALFRIRIRK